MELLVIGIIIGVFILVTVLSTFGEGGGSGVGLIAILIIVAFFMLGGYGLLFTSDTEENVTINYGDACIDEYLGKGYDNRSAVQLCNVREVNKDG